jgi:hypothetical protein
MIPFVIAALIVAKTAKVVADVSEQRTAAKISEREGEVERELFGKNADVAEEQAKDAIARGREAEMRLRFKSRTLAGAQQASVSGQGTTVGVGSAGQITESDASLIEADIATVKENAAREAFGFTTEAENLRWLGPQAYNASSSGSQRTYQPTSRCRWCGY